MLEMKFSTSSGVRNPTSRLGRGGGLISAGSKDREIPFSSRQNRRNLRKASSSDIWRLALKGLATHLALSPSKSVLANSETCFSPTASHTCLRHSPYFATDSWENDNSTWAHKRNSGASLANDSGSKL